MIIMEGEWRVWKDTQNLDEKQKQILEAFDWVVTLIASKLSKSQL